MKRINKAGLLILIILPAFLIILCFGGYLYIKMNSPHLLRFSGGIAEKEVRLFHGELPDLVFIKGMNGCENVYPDNASMKVYVTDLEGYVHILDGASRDSLKITKSKKLGTFATGIAEGPDKRIYVNVCEAAADKWATEGGAVWRLNRELEAPEKLTGNYKGINGLAFDSGRHLYFASANADIMRPDGNIFRMEIKPDGGLTEPIIFLSNAGWANGLYFSRDENKLFFSNTSEGCFAVFPNSRKATVVYYKTKIMESIDDLCTDKAGRLWMTDPGKSTVKMFDPKTSRLIRYYIDGIGQTSSCRMRIEHGMEILYITELKRTQNVMSQIYDGRGLIVLPLESLER